MGLQENLSNRPVSDLDLREAILVSPKETIRAVVEKMCAANLGCVFVVDKKKKPLGMFNESMLKRLLISSPSSFLEKPVSDEMSDQCPWVSEDDPIVMVVEGMQLKNLRYVGVKNKKGQIIALTGQKGLMEYIAEYFPRQVMVQDVTDSPLPPEREGE